MGRRERNEKDVEGKEDNIQTKNEQQRRLRWKRDTGRNRIQRKNKQMGVRKRHWKEGDRKRIEDKKKEEN